MMNYLVSGKRMLAVIAPAGGLLSVPDALAQSAPFCQAGASPGFVLGFADLTTRVGDAIGDAIECEHANPANGDTLQKTTTGLSFYRKATNTPTFTDGFNHWALISTGQVVTWTGSSIDPPGTAQAPSSDCPTPPIRRFGTVWSTDDEVRSLLHCPTGQEQAVDVTIQQFEHGWMLRLPGIGAPPARICALFDDGQDFAAFPDTWSADTDPVSTGLSAPAGLLEPERGFGKVWREGTGANVRGQLGWATAPEQSGTGSRQSFGGGQMVFVPGPRLIFALTSPTSAAELWRMFQDTYSG